AAGIEEVLVKMLDVLADPVLQRGADRDVVEYRQVLHVLAQTDSAAVRADRDAELRRQQQDREHLVHSSQPAGVALAEDDRDELKELLENDAVLEVLARGDAYGSDRIPDPPLSQHISWAGGLLDPPGIYLCQRRHGGDGLVHAPDLVGVEHEPAVRPHRPTQ